MSYDTFWWYRTCWYFQAARCNCVTICARVAPQLYYLKQLKRTGLPADDLLYFYSTVIRPVLKYGCAVWHHDLTVARSQKLESLQKRALRIIHQIVCDMLYDSACAFAGVQPLSARRYELGRRFFRSITQSDSCLHVFFPNGVIQKFFPGFSGILFTQYH